MMQAAVAFFLATPSSPAWHQQQYPGIWYRRHRSLAARDTLRFVGNTAEGEIWGLNEDGDFALVGINMDEPTTVYNEESSRRPTNYLDTLMSPSPPSTSAARNEIDERFLGLMRTSDLGSTTSSLKKETFQKRQSPTTARWTASQTESDDANPEMTHKIIGFLEDIFPSLSEPELHRYATGLQAIGFDPNCELRFYLQEQDLDFMKVLHRRYFVAEIVGTTH